MMTSQKRLLILGSMDEFVPLVQMAEDRGVFTIVCDGYSDGPAKQCADRAYTIDIRDASAVAELCRAERVDAVVTAYSDVLAECCAKIAEEAGLPFYLSPQKLELLRSKTLMKQMFDELGVPYPKTARVHADSVEEDVAGLVFPVVTKPDNAWGSHGVHLLDTSQALADVYEDVSQYASQDYILVEEYNDGFEFNMMSWVADGKLHVLEIADREKSEEIEGATPHVSRIVYPSRLTDLVIDQARDIAQKVASHIGLVNGPLCMQFFWSPERGVQVCECAGRIFGYEHELLAYGTDGRLSIEELLLDMCFEPGVIEQKLSEHDPHLDKVACGLYFHGYERTIGELRGIYDVGDLPGVVETHRYYHAGDTISHGVGAKPYVVRMYLVADTRERLDALSKKVVNSVDVLDVYGQSLLYATDTCDYRRAGV